MEETLGKRIVSHRKRVGMTQDKLAEALGVTAQAVSKWENDQSCPDITMLPKLAQIFDITTDALLGLERKEPKPAEIVPETDQNEPEGFHVQNGSWEFQWDGGRKTGIGLAVWMLLVGALAMLCALPEEGNFPSLWTLTWTCGLLIFGLMGLYPNFSVSRLGCALFGGYFLLFEFGLLPFYLEWKYILPALFLLFGLSLLMDALHKPKHGGFHVKRNGRHISGSAVNHCDLEGDRFRCGTSFGENSYLIPLSRLAGGEADVSFGRMTLDLTNCVNFMEDCAVALECSFGQLDLLLPRRFRAELNNDTAFGSVKIKGAPDPHAAETISLSCSASFGQITVHYI